MKGIFWLLDVFIVGKDEAVAAAILDFCIDKHYFNHDVKSEKKIVSKDCSLKCNYFLNA